MESLIGLYRDTGIYQLEPGQAVMALVGLLLIYLAIKRGFEPLLLLPIGMGAVLVNVPGGGFLAEPILDATGHVMEPGGLLYYVYQGGIVSGIFPLVIFMGIGAMTDFGPLLANPKTLLLGAAAQLGIFTTVIGAVALTNLGVMDFTLADAGAIGIIGGGNMGEALIRGLYKSHALYVCENSSERVKYLKGKYKGIVLGDLEIAQAASLVILAIKPQDMEELLKQIKVSRHI